MNMNMGKGGDEGDEDAEALLIVDVPGFLQIYGDGFISRFDHRPQPPSAHSSSPLGVRTKDVAFEHVQARLFLPGAGDGDRLPLLFYFHGGGFCVGSTSWECYHVFLSRLAAASGLLVVSVDYRLAPEHRLPAAYEDCFSAVRWTAAAGDAWIRDHADLGTCFLAGESAGANIAHVVATMAAAEPVENLRFVGLVVLHPFFGSEERIEREKNVEGVDEKTALEYHDTFWRLALPAHVDRDHPACNPRAAGAPDLKKVVLPPALVVVAELDLLLPRGTLYYEMLRECGKMAEMEVEGKVGHAHFLYDPTSSKSVQLIQRITRFLHERGGDRRAC